MKLSSEKVGYGAGIRAGRDLAAVAQPADTAPLPLISSAHIGPM